MDRLDEILLLQSRLAGIDAAFERAEKGGAVQAGPAGYLACSSHLFSPDIRSAFFFKNCAQAAGTLADFNNLLSGFSVVPRQGNVAKSEILAARRIGQRYNSWESVYVTFNLRAVKPEPEVILKFDTRKIELMRRRA